MPLKYQDLENALQFKVIVGKSEKRYVVLASSNNLYDRDIYIVPALSKEEIELEEKKVQETKEIKSSILINDEELIQWKSNMFFKNKITPHYLYFPLMKKVVDREMFECDYKSPSLYNSSKKNKQWYEKNRLSFKSNMNFYAWEEKNSEKPVLTTNRLVKQLLETKNKLPLELQQSEDVVKGDKTLNTKTSPTPLIAESVSEAWEEQQKQQAQEQLLQNQAKFYQNLQIAFKDKTNFNYIIKNDSDDLTSYYDKISHFLTNEVKFVIKNVITEGEFLPDNFVVIIPQLNLKRVISEDKNKWEGITAKLEYSCMINNQEFPLVCKINVYFSQLKRNKEIEQYYNDLVFDKINQSLQNINQLEQLFTPEGISSLVMGLKTDLDHSIEYWDKNQKYLTLAEVETIKNHIKTRKKLLDDGINLQNDYNTKLTLINLEHQLKLLLDDEKDYLKSKLVKFSKKNSVQCEELINVINIKSKDLENKLQAAVAEAEQNQLQIAEKYKDISTTNAVNSLNAKFISKSERIISKKSAEKALENAKKNKNSEEVIRLTNNLSNIEEKNKNILPKRITITRKIWTFLKNLFLSKKSSFKTTKVETNEIIKNYKKYCEKATLYPIFKIPIAFTEQVIAKINNDIEQDFLSSSVSKDTITRL